VTRGWLLSAREGRQRQPSEERQRATRACGNRRAQRPAHRITCAHLRRPMRSDPVLCPCRVPSHPTRIPFGSIACVLPLPMCATHVCHGIASDAPRGAGRTDAPGGHATCCPSGHHGGRALSTIHRLHFGLLHQKRRPSTDHLRPPLRPPQERTGAHHRTHAACAWYMGSGRGRVGLLALLGRPDQW